MKLSKKEVSGDCAPETKKTKEGSGRSSFETHYSYSALEVKPKSIGVYRCLLFPDQIDKAHQLIGGAL